MGTYQNYRLCEATEPNTIDGVNAFTDVGDEDSGNVSMTVRFNFDNGELRLIIEQD